MLVLREKLHELNPVAALDVRGRLQDLLARRLLLLLRFYYYYYYSYYYYHYRYW